MANYRVIQSFDHPCILNIFMNMELCQTQTYIHINSQLTNDDFDDKVLETLSNLLPIFDQKIFSESSRDENTQNMIFSY